MLFMDVSTWDPSNRDKILEHFKKLEVPEGIDIINQWIDLSGNRIYILYEAENAEAYGAFNLATCLEIYVFLLIRSYSCYLLYKFT